MPDLKQFKLPDLGEGLTEGEILRWLVQPGDTVRLNQPIVEVETAKAAVEVPSPFAGVVTELHHREGETVDVGTPLITFDVAGGGGGSGERAVTAETAPAAVAEHPPTEEAAEPGLIGGTAPGGRTSVLVGYGPRSTAATRRPRKPGATSEGPARSERPARLSGAAVGARAAAQHEGVTVLAKPPVRKLARDLGVDLNAVRGTGPGGTITRGDVEAAAGAPPTGGERAGVAAPAVPGAAWKPGEEERLPVRGVRKHMADAMVRSAFTAPHVTEFVTVDVTPTMDLVDRLKAMPEFADVRVTPLLVVAKALMVAVRRHPLVNSTWDEAAQEIVAKHYVNLGIAAATDRGLVVPNIKDADRLTLPELARAIADLTRTAREGRTAPADMQHGTITITNVGVFGMDTGTPIINPGESAILAFGAVRDMPWVHDGQIRVRKVTQLALSFDHRIIDGRLGSLFLADVAALLADPATTFLTWG